MNEEREETPAERGQGELRGREVTIGCVGDVHGRLDRLERVAGWLDERAPDLVLVTGDFGVGAARDSERALRTTLETLEPLEAPVLWVAGNHDPPDLDGPGNVDRTVAEVSGLQVFGLGGSTPTPARLPYEWADEELAGLELPTCDVVLSHDAPAGTGLDVIPDGRHVGSRVVRRMAGRHSGALVCGHIHEAVGAEKVGRSLCYNVGSLGPPRGGLQAGVLIREPDGAWEVLHRDLESGAGWTARMEEPPAD